MILAKVPVVLRLTHWWSVRAVGQDTKFNLKRL